MPLHLEIVTAERTVFSGEVDMVTVPGSGGVMGVLPHHAPVLSTLRPGELHIKVGDEITYFAIGGGFVDIRGDRVIILADSAERADEIDIARAELARQRAQELLRNTPPLDKEDLFKTEAALRRSQVRLQVARRYRAQRGLDTSA
ncbi:MAG: F0F1 ATP synthase subunit epsilon [Thermoflexales bacterium]